MTEKQQKFLEVLFDEAKGDIRTAMNIAGYSSKTPVTMLTDSLAEEIYEATRKYIARCATPAAFTMGEILKGDPEDADFLIGLKERMAAAKDILDRAGLVKTEKVEVTSKDPLFILPAKKEDD